MKNKVIMVNDGVRYEFAGGTIVTLGHNAALQLAEDTLKVLQLISRDEPVLDALTRNDGGTN